MSRHNRRRTRIRHKAHTASNFESPAHCKAGYPEVTLSAVSLQDFIHSRYIATTHCHSAQIAWQDLETRQREERQRKRIFGGESDEGDEDGICSRMMEFFNGLDYINAEH